MKKIILMALFGASLAAHAQEANPETVQPYIESLKKKHNLKPNPAPPPVAAASEPKNILEANSEELKDPKKVQPYIEDLRQKQGLGSSEGGEPPRPSDAPSTGVQPYIESLKKGHELEPKYRKKVQWGGGVGIVAKGRFDITSKDAQANNFESVYRTNDRYNPSADLFGEWQFLRNQYFGSLGLIGHVTVISTRGKGVFTRSQTKSEDTEFKFLALPFSGGLNYKFTLARFVVPFVNVGLLGIPFTESRNDDKPARKSFSRGYNVAGGIAVNIDWIARKDAWQRYEASGILHTYLMLEINKMQTTSGSVAFNYTGTYAGLMFEF